MILKRFFAVAIFALLPAVTISADQVVIQDAKQPQLAVDGKRVHLVYGSGNRIYHCLSADDGETFGEPITVGGARFLSLGVRRGPRVAVAGNMIVVTAIGGEVGGGRDGDLFAWRSANDGQSWSEPVRVNDVDVSAREGLHAMAAGSQGLLYCAWLDLRNKRTEIVGASSSDGGTTWSENRLVYRSPDGSVCECCHPSVAFGPAGTVLVMWRNSLGGHRDMYFARSKDGGRTFDPARRLGNGTWQLDACPMDGGAFAVDEAGTLHTVWRREKTVYATNGKPEPESRLGDGEQPWLTMTDGGPATAWLSRRPGDLLVKLPGATAPVKLATAARDPVIASSARSVVVAWETEQNGKPAIEIETLSVRSGGRPGE